MNKEYTALILESKALAINSIKKFLTKLDINPDAFEHIYNIDIKVASLINYNNLDDETVALYDPTSFTISIDKDYLDDAIIEIIKNKEDRDMYIIDTAKYIVHEMIHAIRTIMIDNNYHKLYMEETQEKGIPSVAYEYDLKYNSNEVSKSAEETIEYQEGFEEALTSVISVIIIMTRNSNDLDLEPAVNRIRKKAAYDSGEKATALLVQSLGPEMLKWFMTSTYEDSYYNYFLKEYGPKYDELVKYIGSLYNKNNSRIQNKAENIINENKKIA